MDKLGLNVTEAAALLGVSRPTMYVLLKQKGFPSFKVGRRAVISRAGLEEWVAHQAAKGKGL